MNRRRMSCLCSLAMATAACSGAPKPVVSSDVVTVISCPDGGDGGDGGECQLVADGASLVTVRVCVPDSVQTLASPLALTLRTSAGTWQNPPDPTQPVVYTASLSGIRCVSPTLVTPTTTLLVRVDAQLAGFDSVAFITLKPATLRSVELTAMPPLLTPGQVNELPIRAVVRAVGLGSPTSGTSVAFQATALPAGTYASMWPTATIIDQTGQATSTLVVASGATAATVTVTATGPVISGQPQPSNATATVTLAALHADAGSAP
jgi:hypothetical protein